MFFQARKNIYNKDNSSSSKINTGDSEKMVAVERSFLNLSHIPVKRNRRTTSTTKLDVSYPH